MKAIRLRPGERAPDHADRVIINSLPTGKFGFMGVTSAGAEYPARSEPIYAVTPNEFESYEEAEAASIVWAKEHGVAELLIETDGAPEP